MTKSYLFLALVLGLVLVNTCSAKPNPNAEQSDDDESDEEDESESDNEDEVGNEENPAPICLLFGNRGCHVECAVTAEAYDVTAEGYCSPQQTCQCHISGDVSFHDRWEKIFDADYVYRKMNEDAYVEDQAHRIFSFPLRDAKEFKKLLKAIISPYQFSKLKINDDSKAAQFTENGDDKIDLDGVKKYVSEKVGKLLKSKDNKSLLKVKYQQKFKKYLNESGGDKGTLYNLTFRVRQLKNKALEEVLKEYLKKNKLEEPQIDEIGNEGLAVALINAVDNEIMKQIDQKNKAPAEKKKAAPAKKAVAKNGAKTKPAAKAKSGEKKKPAEKAESDQKKE